MKHRIIRNRINTQPSILYPLTILCLHTYLSETKLLPESDIISFGSPYSAKITLHVKIRLSADRSVFLMIGNLLCYISNTNITFIIESEHVCASYFPWFYWDVLMYHLVPWLCLLKCKACSTIFYVVVYIIIILTLYIDSCARCFDSFLFPCDRYGVDLVPVFLVYLV